jgi:hypothetical protein
MNTVGVTRVVRVQAGVGDAGLALQPLPGDAGDRGMHGLAHLLVYRGNTMVLTGIVPWRGGDVPRRHVGAWGRPPGRPKCGIQRPGAKCP